MNPRRITDEELELLALRWARAKPGRILNNINVDCFIAGFKCAQEVLTKDFGNFLIDEGQYYQYQYSKERIDSCGYAGIPLTNRHEKEFASAIKIGEMLEDVGIKYIEYKILPRAKQ